jgi:hypothetical protein
MRTARTVADREAGLARQQQTPGPAPRQGPAGQDKAGSRPARIAVTAGRDTARDPAMARTARQDPPVTARIRAMTAPRQGETRGPSAQQASHGVALIRICAST